MYTFLPPPSHLPFERLVDNGKNAHFWALLYGRAASYTSGARMIRESSESNTGFAEIIVELVDWYVGLYDFDK
jgi:hypothetical protein